MIFIALSIVSASLVWPCKITKYLALELLLPLELHKMLFPYQVSWLHVPL